MDLFHYAANGAPEPLEVAALQSAKRVFPGIESRKRDISHAMTHHRSISPLIPPRKFSSNHPLRSCFFHGTGITPTHWWVFEEPCCSVVCRCVLFTFSAGYHHSLLTLSHLKSVMHLREGRNRCPHLVFNNGSVHRRAVAHHKLMTPRPIGTGK